MTGPLHATHKTPTAALPLLPEVVLSHARIMAGETAYIYLHPAAPSQELTFGTLADNAYKVAQGLLAAGCKNKDRVALSCGHGPEFVTGLLAIFLARCAAVPVAFPSGTALQLRTAAILAEAGCAAILTDASPDNLAKSGATELFAAHTVLNIANLAIHNDPHPDMPPSVTRPDDVAIVQYTSGSTNTPRGVIVTHGALAAEQQAIADAVRPGAQERVVTWLPPEHDMGLMGGLMFNLWRGQITCVLSPAAFIRRPVRWLEAISHFKGTISVAPNFAYTLCADAIPPERRTRLDLSSWRIALNGAEPVQAETMERFAHAFAPCGFDARAFLPCYGLAEATLLVSGANGGSGAVVGWFDSKAMEHGSVVATRAGQGRRFVSSGPVRTTGGVRIVSAETGQPCPQDRIGEIWIAGDSLGSGYLGRPEDSRHTFGARTADGSGPYLRSGDTGFLHDGELYVTGRIKDIVLWHGRTLHASDLEQVLEDADARVRPRRIALWQTDDSGVALMAEVKPLREDQPHATPDADLAANLWRQLLAKTGVDANRVMLVRPGTLLWTSSGKLRRSASHARTQTEPERILCDWRADNTQSRLAQLAAIRSLAEAKEAGTSAFLEFFTDWVAAATGVEFDEVDPDLPWADQGLDSLMMTNLLLDLESAIGQQVPTEDMFDLPNLRALSSSLASRGKGVPR